MSSQFDNLLTPISEASPCGDEHVYSRQLRNSFSNLRKPEQPDSENDTSFRRTADWDSVVELAESALSEQTKDIRIVCHLLEAWTQIRGFDGLHDGLKLLTAFVETCWDRSNPAIDDGDLEVRTAPLENMLDDVERGSCFPLTVRQIKLLGRDAHRCNFLEYQELHQTKDDDRRAELNQILKATDANEFALLTQNIDDSLEQLAILKTTLAEKLGDQTPGLTYLRDAIVDCQRVVQACARDISPPQELEPETQSNSTGLSDSSGESIGQSEAEQHADSAESPLVVPRVGLNSREDAYRQLAEVAEYLKQTEPHSPIPYLVGRAVELGKLPFPRLVKQLIREEGILDELRREFGITELAEELMGEAG